MRRRMPRFVAMIRMNTRLEGLLGAALDANRRGRLFHFIENEHSPAVQIFSPEHRDHNEEGDWYGEHAGKWLVAAAKAAVRADDGALAARVQCVADHLVAVQEPDGYLGTYAPSRRFMVKQPPKLPTWDGAPSVRTWDIWTLSYLVLGLIEAHRHLPDAGYLEAAGRIGDLCWATLSKGDIDITELGNHFGLSATVLLDAAMALHIETADPRYLELAKLVRDEADAAPQLALVTKALAGADAAEIATGKAYQLAWNLVGLAKLARVTGDVDLLRAVELLWQSIRTHHLTLGGGPWGGVAHRSREVFNAPGSFDPQAYVETCSTLAWLQLNRELLAISDDPRYADEIERSAYNDLLGAMAANGEDWCYYSFPNGRRVHTTYWRCCKSSGAMAIEELPPLAYRCDDAGTLTIDIYGPGETSFVHPEAGRVDVIQATAYPFDGAVDVQVATEHAARFAIRLRIPAWCEAGATVGVNGAAVVIAPPGYHAIERDWRSADRIALQLPMAPRVHMQAKHNVQESRAPDGSPVRQEVLHHEYVAVTRGPLVYATSLIDGFKTEETIRLPDAPRHEWLTTIAAMPGEEGPTLMLHALGRAPIPFVPYYRAGGRVDGAWRLTWLSLSPLDASRKKA